MTTIKDIVGSDVIANNNMLGSPTDFTGLNYFNPSFVYPDAWSTQFASISAPGGLRPDGSANQKLAEDTNTSVHRLFSFTEGGLSVLFDMNFIRFRKAFLIKPVERTRVVAQIAFNSGGSGSNAYLSAGFDLAGLRVFDHAEDAGWTFDGANIIPAFDGYSLCTLDGTYTIALNSYRFYQTNILLDNGSGMAARSTSYTGNGTSGVLLWWQSLMPKGAWLLDTLVFYDDFDDIATIDVNDTRGDGFKWYTHNLWPNCVISDFGATTNPPSAPTRPASISVASSKVTIYDPIDSGGLFLGQLWSTVYTGDLGGGPTGYKGFVYHLPAFYESSMAYDAATIHSASGIFGTPATWSLSIEGLIGTQNQFVEMDVEEIGNSAPQTNWTTGLHNWTGPLISSGHFAVGDVAAINWQPAMTDAALSTQNRYAVLLLDAPSNNGTRGLKMAFFNGHFWGSAQTWSTTTDVEPPQGFPPGAMSMIDTQHLNCIIDTAIKFTTNPAVSASWDWVKVWTPPPPPPPPPPPLYAATAPFISRAADAPANQQFEGSLQSTIRVDRSLSEGSGGYGGWSESVSELSLINADGFYDALASNASMNGQSVAVRLGQFDVAGLVVQPYAMFEQLASLIAEKFSVSRQNLTIFMRDPLAHLQQTLVQTQVFAGTGDLEGGAEIAGKRRPFVGGWVFNVTPVLVIPSELLYQVNAGPLEAIVYVRDGGVELTFGGEFETVDELRAAALDGTLYPGLYGTCLREGYFILGGANEKQVTVECYGPQLTTGTIAAWLAAKSSGRSVLDDDRHDFLYRAFLSNGFTTATAATSISSNYVNFFSTDSKSSGKYVFSILPTVISGSDYGFGFANADAGKSLDGSQRLGWDNNSVGVYGATGAVLFNGAATGEVGNTFTSNDLVPVAVDLGTRKWWYRIGVGNWNNNALANPATGVGGFNLGFTGDVFAALVLSNIASEDINFRPDGVTLPAGFSFWGPVGSFALDVATINLFEGIQPAVVGCYLDTDINTSVADLLAQILAGVGGWFSFSTISFFQIFRFDAPTAAESLISYDSVGGNIVEIDRTNLPDSLDPPPKRRRVKYRRNYTIQTDLFGQITEDDPGLADQFRSDSQLASTTEAQTAAILADFPDAPDPDPVESYFLFEEDALAEANRLLTLYSSGRFPYRFTLRNVLFSHKIGDVVQVTDSRLGLSSGKYLRLISISDDTSPMTTEVIGFG